MSATPLISACAAILLLAGCALPNFQSSPDPQPPQAGPVSTPDQLSALSARPAPSGQTTRVVPEVAPSALVGARADQVSGWIGSPDAVWPEGEHSMWRYARGDCAILLFLDASNTVRRALVLRRDGEGSAGCDNAVGRQVASRTS